MAAANITGQLQHPSNYIPADIQQLFNDHSKPLEGNDLVEVARYYSTKALMEQANQYRPSGRTPYRPGIYSHFLSKAIDKYAMALLLEPDEHRDAYNIERAGHLKAMYGDSVQVRRMWWMKCTMPQDVFVLSQQPGLQELKQAHDAYLVHTCGGYRIPSEYWVKLYQYVNTHQLKPAQLQREFGFKTYDTARVHMAEAKRRAPQLIPILAKVSSPAQQPGTSAAGTTARKPNSVHSRTKSNLRVWADTVRSDPKAVIHGGFLRRLGPLAGPPIDSGETNASILAFVNFVRDWDPQGYTDLEFGRYLVFCVDVWLLDPERGTLLDHLTRCLQNVDEGMWDMDEKISVVEGEEGQE